MGLGFQGFRWLRKKQSEDARRERDQMNKLIDQRADNVKHVIEKMQDEIVQHKELNNVLIRIEELKGQLVKHEHMLSDLAQKIKDLKEAGGGRSSYGRK